MPNRRINGPGSHSFHFGVDISAPDGTPVYAVAPGTVFFPSDKAASVQGQPVAVGVRGDGVSFEYWHIRPVVSSGRHVIKRQLLGHIIKGMGHVHLAEMCHGRAVNPLRAGGLTPYFDHTRPTIVSVALYRNESYSPLPGTTLSGSVDLVVDAYDRPAMTPDWSWAVVSPALIRWSLQSKATGETVIPMRTEVDFRLLKPKVPLADIYAPGTLENGPHQTGVYKFWLARSFDTSKLQSGAYELTVSASDTRGNTAKASLAIRVAN